MSKTVFDEKLQQWLHKYYQTLYLSDAHINPLESSKSLLTTNDWITKILYQLEYPHHEITPNLQQVLVILSNIALIEAGQYTAFTQSQSEHEKLSLRHFRHIKQGLVRLNALQLKACKLAVIFQCYGLTKPEQQAEFYKTVAEDEVSSIQDIIKVFFLKINCPKDILYLQGGPELFEPLLELSPKQIFLWYTYCQLILSSDPVFGTGNLAGHAYTQAISERMSALKISLFKNLEFPQTSAAVFDFYLCLLQHYYEVPASIPSEQGNTIVQIASLLHIESGRKFGALIQYYLNHYQQYLDLSCALVMIRRHPQVFNVKHLTQLVSMIAQQAQQLPISNDKQLDVTLKLSGKILWRGFLRCNESLIRANSNTLSDLPYIAELQQKREEKPRIAVRQLCMQYNEQQVRLKSKPESQDSDQAHVKPATQKLLT